MADKKPTTDIVEASNQDMETSNVNAGDYSILAVISRAAMDPLVDVEKMERLFVLQERLLDRDAKAAYSVAMNAAQQDMRQISQDSNNSQTHSKYASYGALNKAIRPIYIKHGFYVSFDTGDTSPGEYVTVIAHVAHSGGHTQTHSVVIPTDGKGAKGNDVMTKTHALMSGVSYGRRGLVKMIFNISEGEHDDDGNAAGSQYITEEQSAHINSELDRLEADKRAFCNYMKVDAIPHIISKDYGKADAAIKAKDKKQKEGSYHEDS